MKVKIEGLAMSWLSGIVYRDAHCRIITDPTQQLFVPIIQWIDRTHIAGNGRFFVQAVHVYPSHFHEDFRRKIQAWGYHGFLPKTKLSKAQNQSSMKLPCAIIQSVEIVQHAGPQLTNVSLPFVPNRMMRVDVITCILFVKQDTQEGDLLCGPSGTHASGIQRRSRAFNVDHANLNNPDVKISF